MGVKILLLSRDLPAGCGGCADRTFTKLGRKCIVADAAVKLGIKEGQIALELGWDEDCDTAISESILSLIHI